MESDRFDHVDRFLEFKRIVVHIEADNYRLKIRLDRKLDSFFIDALPEAPKFT